MQTTTTTRPKTIRIRTTPAPRVFGDGATAGGLITCRVCERVEMVCLGHPALLCAACLEDLSATDAHVSGVYAAALAFFMEACEGLRCAVEESSVRAWWARVEAVRMAADKDDGLISLAWARAKAGGGEKLRLCELSERVDREAVTLEPLNAWYTAAIREIRAARAAIGEPIYV